MHVIPIAAAKPVSGLKANTNLEINRRGWSCGVGVEALLCGRVSDGETKGDCLNSVDSKSRKCLLLAPACCPTDWRCARMITDGSYGPLQ